MEALKKEDLTALELSNRVGVEPYYFMLLKLEDEGLVKYDLTTGKWRLKKG